MNSRVNIEELDNDEIDENKLNEFDQEVSNYLDEMYDENNGENNYPKEELVDNHPGYNYNKYDMPHNYYNYNNDDGYDQNYLQNISTSPHPVNAPNVYAPYYPGNPNNTNSHNFQQINFNLTEENEKLKNKIHEYQKLNKEWELKVNTIKNVLNQMEKKNNYYKEEYEKVKDENEQCQFKLKLLTEKEKIHEANLKNLKELQTGYDTQNNDLKREYKLKEENLKKRYEKYEESQNEKLKNQEEEYLEKIEKLNYQIKNLQKSNELCEKDCDVLREKLIQSENFLQSKEQEFNEIVLSKDRKLKELENCVRSISEEANNQINKLTESVGEFNDKINMYKQRELQLTQDYQNLKNILKNIQNNNSYVDQPKQETINDSHRNNAKRVKSMNNSSNSFDFNKEKTQSNTIDILRNRVKELEEETMQLSRELNLKYEECETLNEELRVAYETTRNNESNMHIIMKDKEDEVSNLTNKINHLENIINKYGKNLANIKKSYDKSVHNHKVEFQKKDDEMNKMKEKYEKKIEDLQNKIEEILIKDNIFIQSMNRNNTDAGLNNPNSNLKIINKSPIVYTPIEIPDDEVVRNNISQQINYIKEKLDKNFYS